MSDQQTVLSDRTKKDRSPSFPFISLRKAVERAEQFQLAHKRDSARLSTIASTWGYGTKSSGLLQTAAALKQYGLLEDVGSGEERKLRLTDLARTIIGDTRPGFKEKALDTAARHPKLFAEYIERWVPDGPSDNHCVSELEHDRGFTHEAARAFLKAFRLTVSYAGLLARDSMSASSAQNTEIEDNDMEPANASPERATQPPVQSAGAAIQVPDHPTSLPFRRRYQVTLSDNKLAVSATLIAPDEVDKLIRLLEANKALLDEFDNLNGDEEAAH